jgi:hypothetical protein
VLAEAFRDQAAVLAEAVTGGGGAKKLSSTIRINPTIKWPMLSDDGPDSKDVEEFFERFDETCALANDGAGMADAERLKVLLSCLRGSREKVYRVIHKRCRASGLLASNPEEVFSLIKERLMRFVETPMEKPMRVLQEWEALTKGRSSALQFEPLWDEALAELESVGLGRSARELLLAYLQKVGPQHAADIQKDQRPWPDGEGGMVNRRVATWEEAHKVSVELESLKAGGRALNSSYAAVDAFDRGRGRPEERSEAKGGKRGRSRDHREGPGV